MSDVQHLSILSFSQPFFLFLSLYTLKTLRYLLMVKRIYLPTHFLSNAEMIFMFNREYICLLIYFEFLIRCWFVFKVNITVVILVIYFINHNVILSPWLAPFPGYSVQNCQQRMGVFIQAWLSVPILQQHFPVMVSLQAIQIQKMRPTQNCSSHLFS